MNLDQDCKSKCWITHKNIKINRLPFLNVYCMFNCTHAHTHCLRPTVSRFEKIVFSLIEHNFTHKVVIITQMKSNHNAGLPQCFAQFNKWKSWRCFTQKQLEVSHSGFCGLHYYSLLFFFKRHKPFLTQPFLSVLEINSTVYLFCAWGFESWGFGRALHVKYANVVYLLFMPFSKLMAFYRTDFTKLFIIIDPGCLNTWYALGIGLKERMNIP